MTNISQAHSQRRKSWFKSFISALMAFLMVLNVCTPIVQAALEDEWDGTGDTSGGTGGGNVTVVPGGFSLSNADANDIYGYRFSVYDGQGNKLGYGIDILFKAESAATKRSDEKKSHVDLYREYLNYIGEDEIPNTADDGTPVSLGALHTVKGTAENQSDIGLYYDSTLPRTPAEVEKWLTPEQGDAIATKCDATEFGSFENNYIICEPLFRAKLAGTVYCMTLAEYAVYQSGYYDSWTHVPSAEELGDSAGTYGIILRHLSSYFGTFLYAEERYEYVDENGNKVSVFETEPVEESKHLRPPAADMPNHLLFSDHNLANTAENILKYQMGMAVYTGKIPTWTLTIDPSGGTYEGESGLTEIGLLEDSQYALSLPVRPGYIFTGWDIDGPSSIAKTDDGYVYTQGGDNCTITAEWEPANVQFTVNHWLQNSGGNKDSFNEDNYTRIESVPHDGVIGNKITVTHYQKNFAGFSPYRSQVDGVNVRQVVLEDGSLVIDIYYARNQYELTVGKGTGIETVLINGVPATSGTFYFEDRVELYGTPEDGYQWNTWLGSKDNPYVFYMPAENVSEMALATPNIHKVQG